MGAFRVTQRVMVDRVLSNLNNQYRGILNLQEQLSTGLRLNRPSDGPLGTRRAINAEMEIAKNNQYLTNMSTASPVIVQSESSLMSVVDILQRVKDLGLQGSNATNAAVQREQIASEIDQLLESVLVESNTITNGRYIFSGTRTNTPAFTETRDVDGNITAVTYSGNSELYQIEISENVYVPGNIAGDTVFEQTSPDSVDIFDMIIAIRDNLRAGDFNGLETNLGQINQAQEQLMISVSRLGALENRFERVEESIRDVIYQLEIVKSDNVDADFAEVILELNAQSNAFQASLSAGANVIQPSLLDFLR